MLCKPCQSEAGRHTTRRSPGERCRTATCDRCGAAILMLEGVAVGVGDGTLARLARFGLASTGQPLLETSRERA
jgi:hypothetical protein